LNNGLVLVGLVENHIAGFLLGESMLGKAFYIDALAVKSEYRFFPTVIWPVHTKF